MATTLRLPASAISWFLPKKLFKIIKKNVYKKKDRPSFFQVVLSILLDPLSAEWVIQAAPTIMSEHIVDQCLQRYKIVWQQLSLDQVLLNLTLPRLVSGQCLTVMQCTLRSFCRKVRVLVFVFVIVEQVYLLHRFRGGCFARCLRDRFDIVFPLNTLFALGLQVFAMLTFIPAVVARAQLTLQCFVQVRSAVLAVFGPFTKIRFDGFRFLMIWL